MLVAMVNYFDISVSFPCFFFFVVPFCFPFSTLSCCVRLAFLVIVVVIRVVEFVPHPPTYIYRRYHIIPSATCIHTPLYNSIQFPVVRNFFLPLVFLKKFKECSLVKILPDVPLISCVPKRHRIEYDLIYFIGNYRRGVSEALRRGKMD